MLKNLFKAEKRERG